MLVANGIWRISGSGAISEFHLSGGGGVGLAATAAGPVFGLDGSFWLAQASFFPAPQAAIEVGTPTGSLTQFDVTSAVSSLTYGPDGNIWFIAPATGAASATIGSITMSGVIRTIELPAGSAPRAIATGSDGNLWLTDAVNNQIGRLTIGGVFTLFSIPTANSSPWAITGRDQTAHWFTEASANQIGRISTTGAVTEFMIPTPNSGPNGITVGSDGNIWFTESAGKVGWITTSGAITELIIPAANARPTYIAAKPDGTVWFVDSGPGHPGGSDRIGRISPTASCSDAHTLCLNNSRFSVTATFQSTSESPSTPATAVPLTNDTGYFWFFDPTNIELVVKALTGCSVNGNYWVFTGGLTDVGVELKVTDTLTGAVKSYSNPLSTPFQPIQDTTAFPCP